MRTYIATLFGVVVLVFLAGSPASAQLSRLPAAVQVALAEIGPQWQSDIRTFIPRTRELFLPLLAEAPKAGVSVTPDIAYGDDPKQRLDVYRPAAVVGAPIIIFVHGGALTRGDKNTNAEAYANVLYFFGRHGLVGINGNYRLAPQHRYPAAAFDIGRVVAWAQANAADYGGDPGRIFLIGHSSGGTHAATWAYDRKIHGPAGPGIAGLILLSGRLRADNRPDDPNPRVAKPTSARTPLSIRPARRSPTGQRLTYRRSSSLLSTIIRSSMPTAPIYSAGSAPPAADVRDSRSSLGTTTCRW